MFMYCNTVLLINVRPVGMDTVHLQGSVCLYIRDKLGYANQHKIIGHYLLIMSSYETHIPSHHIFDLEQE